MRILRTLLLPASTAALVLGGCATSEDLAPQTRMNTPAALSADKALANSSGKFAATWPAGDWWHALGDTQLNALIGEALHGSPDLAAADARLRQATAQALNADAARSPTLKAQASVQGIHVPGKLLSPSADDQYFTPKILGLSGSYGIDLWGGERAAWEAATGRQQAAEVDAQAARLTLSANVARAYAQLGYAWQACDLARKDAERAAHLLALTTQRVTAGIDSSAQQRQAETLAAGATQRQAQAAHAIESARIALAILIGKGPDRAAEISRPAVLEPLALALPDNLPAALLGRRPDIVAARWRVEAAQRDIDAAKTGFYPNVNLSAAIGLVSLHGDDLISLRNRYYSVAPAISLPIFDGGRLRAGLAGRNAEYDLAVAHYNQTLVGALNEVARQIQAGQSLLAQMAAQQQSAQAARAAWELARQRYQRGIASQIEALGAEQAVLAAEAALAAIRQQQIDAGIQLVHALGGGYGNTVENAASPHTPATDKASS